MLNFMTEVTSILSQIEDGDPSAAEKLLPLVYDELRKLAAARMAEEPAIRRCKRLHSFTKLIFDWWTSNKFNTGIRAGTSSRQRPRRCGEFWLTRREENAA
jgi:hypothetical protein